MKTKLLSSITFLFPLIASAQSNITEQQCLNLLNASYDDVVIQKAEWNASGEVQADRMAALTGGSGRVLKAKPHCVVTGEIGARTGSDGKPYGIKFQLRLPNQWNNGFLYQGGGGMDGFIAPALGGVPFRASTATPALMRGYAVVSTDSGHPTPTAEFAADQQARLDYAYASIGKVTATSKKLIQQIYGSKPKNNVFMGCSNGGRAAMIAAQRYPLEFNGVIAANPGFRLSRAAIAEVWDTKAFMEVAPTNEKGEKILANAFTQQDLDVVRNVLMERCDAKDGLADGVINHWESCDFKPQMVQCSADKKENCLTEAQVSALDKIFNGAKNSQGEAIYSGWYYDSGINQKGWRDWKLGYSQTAEANARNVTLGSGSMLWYFLTPPQPDFDLSQFDFDKDTLKTYQTATINDAVSTDLSSFKANGGKLIIVTGASDPVFSALDQVNWFKQLNQDTKQATDFSRLFVVPGLTHCGGGEAFDNFDPLTALESWQNKGKAPEKLIATSSVEVFKDKSMPICAYPTAATYVGGDKNKAESFECR